MKTKTKLQLFPLFLLLIMFSCKDVDIVEEQSKVETSITTTRSVDVTSDESKHQAQSDFENMLMDQVIFRDSIYVLNMSRDEAQDLTIPDSLYNVFINIVDNLNMSK